MGPNPLADPCRGLPSSCSSSRNGIGHGLQLAVELVGPLFSSARLFSILMFVVSFSIVAFATPSLFGAIRGGAYFVIAAFVFISIILVVFVYHETAHKTLEELSEVFGEKGFVNVMGAEVPDPSSAMMTMHMSNRERNMSRSRTAMSMGVGISVGIPMHARVLTGGVVESGIGAAPVHSSRGSTQLEKELRPKPLRVPSSSTSSVEGQNLGLPAEGRIGGRLSVGAGGHSALTSQATLIGVDSEELKK